MIEFDVLIVGAGVAGCASALELLAAGWRVAIIERRDDVRAVESLSPSAVKNLSRLSIQTGTAISEIIAWWGTEHEVRANQPGARIVQRNMLAEILRVRALERGAKLIQSGKFLSVQRLRGESDTGFELIIPGNSKLTASYIVDATGRASVIGRSLGARRYFADSLVSVSVSLQKPDLVGVWTESASNGWWNLCCIPDQGTLSFYSFAPDLRQARNSVALRLAETRHMRHLLPAPVLGAPFVRPCGSSRLVPCSGTGWVAVGDAAATIQPLTSTGVAKALRDARMVGQALHRDPADYDRFQLAEFRLYLRELERQYALERSWSTKSFWASCVTPKANRLELSS